MSVQGRKGRVGQRRAAAECAAGARIETGRGVARIESGRVALRDGSEVKARAIVVNADPFRMLQMADFPEAYVKRIDRYRRDGTTMKVTLALRALPRFTCLPADRRAYGSTMQLLPDEAAVIPA